MERSREHSEQQGRTFYDPEEDITRYCPHCGEKEVYKRWPRQPAFEVSNLGNIREYYGKNLGYGTCPLFDGYGYWDCMKVQRKNQKTYRIQYYDRTQKKKRWVSVSTVVLEAFVGPAPKKKPIAIRKDGDKSNDCLCNLSWR